MKVLFVSPHPDDVEIGCGGLISRLVREGKTVDIAVCTGPGDLTMLHSGMTIPFKQRKEEQKVAARILGVNSVGWLEHAPAGQFDTVPQMKLVSSFDKLFGVYDEVYLPLPAYNDDHTQVWKAGMAAIRPGKVDHLNVYAYEQQCSNAVGAQLPGREFGRKYFVLDPQDVDRQTTAIWAHTSQVAGRDAGICGPKAVETFAKMRGVEVGVEFAVMVYVIRERA